MGIAHRARVWTLLGALVLLPVALSTSAGATSPPTAPPVRFLPSTTAAGATAAVWGFRFTLTQSVGPGAPIQITLPAGARFTNPVNAPIVDLSTGRDESAGVTFGAGNGSINVFPRDALSAGDVVAVSTSNVTNPPKGTPFSAIQVTPSGSIPTGAGSFTAGSAVTGLQFTPSTTARGASGVTWGLEFRSSATGRLPLGGTITVSAPTGGTFGTAAAPAVVDLTTFTNLGTGGAVYSNANHTATLTTARNAGAGDLIAVAFYGNTNPATGAPLSSLGLSTGADPIAAHPSGGGSFTAPGAVSGATFTASSTAGGASANWGVLFRPSATGRVLNGGAVTLTVPSGTTFPTALGNYTLRDVSTGRTFSLASETTTATKLAVALEDPDAGTIRAGDTVVLMIAGVTNPAGGISAGQVSVATSSDLTPAVASAPAGASGGRVGGFALRQSTPAAGATGVVWTAQFATAHPLAANAGTITLSAPAGTFPSNAFVVLTDLTGGETCCTTLVGDTGSTVTVKPNFTIAAGDLVTLEVHGATNPAAGSYPTGDFSLSTSSDATPAHPPAPIAFASAQAPQRVTGSADSLAGNATETAWTSTFTASSTGGIADDALQPAEITFTIPGTIEASHDDGAFDLATGSYFSFAGSAQGPHSTTVFVPGDVSPGDPLAVTLVGVDNPPPGAQPAGSVSVTTASDTVTGPAPALTLTTPNLPATDLLGNTDPSGSSTTDHLYGETQASSTGELSGALNGVWGSLTLSAPSGTTFSPSNCVWVYDLTAGSYGCDFPISPSGSSVTVRPGYPTAAGDLLAFSTTVTNPAAGLTPPAGFHLNTSSDDGVPSAGPGALSGTEGAAASGTVMTVNGDCPASATITSWGDGTASSPGSVSCQGLIASVIGTHTYNEFGSYPVAATTSDGTSGTATATISDAALTAAATHGLTATAGTPFTSAVATVTDANPDGVASVISATVNWGDGTSSPATVSGSGGHFTVAGSHTYTKTGNLILHVSVTDAGGSTTAAVASVTVNPAGAPAVTLTSPANGSTVTTATPTFAGSAGATAADNPVVTVNVYSGDVVAGSPVQTVTAAVNSAGAWSTTASAALANGTYTAQAQQSTTAGVIGRSAANVFTINAPTTPPPPPPGGPGSGGGPPAGCLTGTPLAYGVFAAVGCLQTVVDPSQIPSAERTLLCAKLKKSGKACDREISHEIATDTPRLATGIVRVNGLDYTPASGSVILFDPAHKLLVSANAKVQMMGDVVTLHSGALTIDGAKPVEVPELEANLDSLGGLAGGVVKALDLAGFKLTGTLTVKLAPGVTNLVAAIKLPDIFTAPGGGSLLTAQATAVADNAQDIQFNQLLFQGPDVNLGGFTLNHVAFCYQNHISEGLCQKKTGVSFGAADPSLPSWNVTANVMVAGFGLDAAPPPPTYGLGFVGGSFAFGGATLGLGPGVPIGPGVTLTHLGGSFGLDPIRMTGTAGVRIVNLLDADGSFFLVIPANGQSYTFTGGELGQLFAPLTLPKITVNQLAFGEAGTVSLELPVIGNVRLSDGYFLYAFPSYIAAGGGFYINILNGALIADGGIQGQLNFARGAIDAEGSLAFTINAGPLQGSLSAAAVVSSVGIGACGTIGPFSGTIGYTWGGSVSGAIGSCDLTPYEAVVTPAGDRAGAAAAGATVHLPGGTPSDMVELKGQGGPPDVTVSGPGGVSGTGAGQHGSLVIVPDPRQDTTWVAVLHPAGGAYTITTNAGSPAISSVLTAHGFTPHIRARVSGGGATRRLHYALNLEPGETVQFVERGQGVDRLIGTARKAHGTLRFHPAPGPGGTRQIVAMGSDGGRPLILAPGSSSPGQLVVASYRAPGPRRLGPVHGLRAARRGARVTVSFHRVRGARSYVVLLTLRSGLRTDVVVHRTRARFAVPTAGPRGGTVAVRALGDGLTTIDGRLRTVRIASRAKHHRRKR